ncbi:DUF2306 domain-containing protein [Bacillus sp. ISL-75]|uniref:DUF2306 domain-containing protein n=1 Tax=Bacillus sp. ISL-75 TaxID=2819137 RepID=UPI001BE9286E|nr:DUF2306 domain-containing protein [Bacillus sp. ISL-75]MBT2729854.1 DUF2306 domain-containing protein [Bacillus sp. ISL-75]
MKPKKSWWILFISSLEVIIPFVVPYLTLNPANSRVSFTSAGMQFPLLIAHIVTACLALLSDFFQFVEHFRIKTPKVHRFLGRVYVGSVLISGGLGLVYVSYIENFSKATSFLVLSLIWLFTCWKGYRTAVRKQFADHRKWMIRSFGVTLVAVSGRIVVPVLLLTYYTLNGFSLPGGREKMVEEVLNVNIWVGLIVNFIVVEWGILRKGVRHHVKNSHGA